MPEDGYPMRWVESCLIVTMPAEIDVTNAEEAGDVLLAAADRRPAALVIDMSATTFCDSAGVNAVISAYRKTAAAGIELRLVTTAVARIFRLIGVDQLIPIYPELTAALVQVTGQQA